MAPSIHRDDVVARIGTLVEGARAAEVPVLWVLHSGSGMPRDSDAWQLVPELAPAPGEAVVHKTFGDSFEATDLADHLAQAGIGSLVVCGAQTDGCIRSTLHGGLTRSFDMTLVSDAHTTEDLRPWGSPIGPADVIGHTNLYWSFTTTPHAVARVVSAAAVDWSAAAGVAEEAP